MPIRNIWSLQPGECMTAEEIMTKQTVKYFSLCETLALICLQLKDGDIRIQIKESRYYLAEQGDVDGPLVDNDDLVVWVVLTFKASFLS